MTEPHETSAGEPGGLCPTGCDPDCDADCHETHDVPARREHRPEDCPSRNGGREAMTDERLAEIRTHHDEYGFVGATDVDSVVTELLAEIERLNDVLHANTVIRNAAESTGRVYKSLAARLRAERDQARTERNAATLRAETAERALAEMRERIGEGYAELNDRAHDGLFFAPDDLSYDAGYSEGLRTAYGAAAAIVRNWKPADGG